MTKSNPYDGTIEAETNQTPPALPKPWTMFPRWWFIFVALFVSLSFAVRLVDQAGGRITLVVTILLATLMLAIRYLRCPGVPLLLRLVPLAAVIAFVVAFFGAVRVDEMDGNLIPKRVSFRWQPAPDERLAKLTPQEAADGVVDLKQTTPDDFPSFLGQSRNGFVDIELDANWNTSPPKLIWKKEEFGAGHSGFAAVNGYAVTLEQRGPEEVVTCYEIATGNLVWSHAETARHETVPGGVGPRSTPTIHEGRVYTMGATGIFLCLDGATGDVLWRKDFLADIETTQEAEFNKIQWGRAPSPLIDKGRVIIPFGIKGEPNAPEKGASLIAFDAITGEELWRKGEHQISYASPVIAEIDGLRQILLVCESVACGFDAESGEKLWEYDWPGNSAGNASCSQAIAIDANRILLSKAYGHGSALLAVRRDGDAWKAETIWEKRVMKTKLTNAVIYDGYIYGLDDSILACVELETGKRMWKRGRYGHGQVLLAGSKLLVQTESGDVTLVEPTPDEFIELARFSPIEGRTWNYPCLYGKTLLVRNGQQAACYELP